MPNIAENLTQVRDAIHSQARTAGRDPASVTLVAVGKTQPARALREAFAHGQRDFGENYLQEALGKIDELSDLPITWHFIGALQSNKTRIVAEHFHWVHTVDRLKLGERLSAQRSPALTPLNICLQINIDDETSKAGCAPDEAFDLAAALSKLPNLRLRGLMAIPKPGNSKAFVELARLQQEIGARLSLSLDTLSMGMSADLDAAIAAGSTLVRVGTAIFGERNRA